MSWVDDLLDGLATQLATLGAGTYDPTGTTGTIVLGTLPDEVNQGIGIRDYSQQPDPALSDVVQPVQLWLRSADEQWMRATTAAIIDGLNGAVNQTIGGVPVSLITLHSDVLLGVDSRGRYERALNFDVSANHATASRPY